jgi:hypothetical protein
MPLEVCRDIEGRSILCHALRRHGRLQDRHFAVLPGSVSCSLRNVVSEPGVI